MTISPQDVKKLRDISGAGFGDCKEALEKAQGDFAAAERLLKEKGLTSVAKRAHRNANEGRIFSIVSALGAGLLELSCETDFVARNGDVVSVGQAVLNELVRANSPNLTDHANEKLKELAMKTKENLSVKSYLFMPISPGEKVMDYIHGEGRIGTLVKVRVADIAKTEEDQLKELAFDLALHVAAFNPSYLDRTKIDETYLKEQENIIRTRDANQLQGKSENVVANIMQGKIEKSLKQICLVDQPFVKDEKISVAQAIDKVAKELNTKVELIDFARRQTGIES